MNVPEEFRRACMNLGPDLQESVKSVDDLVNVALIGVDQKQAAVMRTFLGELLSAGYDTEQMKKFWWATPSTFVFFDGGDVVNFLTRMNELLSQPPYAGSSAN